MVMTVNRVIEESDLAADEKRKAQNNLRRATPDEFDIFHRLFEIPEARKVAGEIFRGAHVVREEFISAIEADHIEHWLWGRIRLLSGDDKSTWYTLLRKPGGATMLYVPDATVTTVEHIEGRGVEPDHARPAGLRDVLLRLWPGRQRGRSEGADAASALPGPQGRHGAVAEAV